MRAVIQRAQQASVTLKEGGDRRTIGRGLLVLLGVGQADSVSDAEYLAGKIVGLRIFDDESGKMNLALTDVPDAAMLVVSQFTLYGDTRKGRRPSFTAAAPPAVAIGLYEHFVATVRTQGIAVVTGEFGADMLVEVANDGPVTLVLDSV